MSGKKKDKAEQTQNLPVNMEAEIKKQLEAQRGHLGALPSNKISLKNKEFTLPDGQKGPELECVVLDYVWFMVHYPGVYNANNPQQPNCFAVGRDQPNSGQLKAHESVETPLGETCHEKVCPKNAWKSAPTGNGKACKNQRRLVLLPPNADEATEPMTLYVSPGGLKNFDAYVARLQNEHQLLPVQVITRVTFDQDQTYPLLKFELVGPHDNMNLFWSKRETAQDLLFRPIEIDKEKDAA
jgi:hypothetical protein